jgi:hypothetical protein
LEIEEKALNLNPLNQSNGSGRLRRDLKATDKTERRLGCLKQTKEGESEN